MNNTLKQKNEYFFNRYFANKNWMNDWMNQKSKLMNWMNQNKIGPKYDILRVNKLEMW